LFGFILNKQTMELDSVFARARRNFHTPLPSHPRFRWRIFSLRNGLHMDTM